MNAIGQNSKSRYPKPPSLQSGVLKVGLPQQQQLLDAIEASDLPRIRKALKSGADINYWFFDARIPDKVKPFPLSVAMENPDRRVVKLLLESGAAVNFCDYTILAVERSDLKLLKLLLEYGASPDGMRYWYPDSDDGVRNDTSLTMAVAERNRAMAEALLHAGADVEHVNNNGECALLIALRSGDRKMVQLILEYASSKHQDSAMAIYEAEKAVVAEQDAQLSDAIRGGRPNEVRRLILEYQRDVSRVLACCEEPLLSYTLLQYNEAVNMVSIEGGDKAKLGSSESIIEVIKVLLELGAPVDTVSTRTPLHRGTQLCERCPEIYEQMLMRASTVDHKDLSTDGTPLISAAVRGEVSAVRLLLKHGADPNLSDRRGQTALKGALYQYKYRKTEKLLEVIRILRDAGAED